MAASKTRLRTSLLGFFAGALVTFLVLGLSTTSAWRGFEQRVEALLLTSRPQPWNPDVVVVALDDEAVRKLELPMPRGQYARVLEAMVAAHVQAVGIDLFFNRRAVDSPQGDEAFARVVAESQRIVLALPCDRGDAPDPQALAPVLAHALPPGATPAFPCPAAIPPYGPLAGAGPVGEVILSSTASGANRGVSAFVDLLGKRLPTMSLQLYRVGHGLAPDAIVQRRDGVQLGPLSVPLDPQGALLVHARPKPDPDHLLSMAELVAALPTNGPARFPKELADKLDGKYVVVGATSPMLSDVGAGLDGSVAPLCLFHTAALSDLLEGHVVRELPRGTELLLIALVGLFLAFCAVGVSPLLAAAAVACSLFGLTGGALLLSQRQDLLMGPLAPATAGVLAFLFALAVRVLGQERDKRILRQAFGDYVDRTLVERLLEQGETFALLQGKRKTLTVLFSDIQGYTGLSNQLPPEEVFAVLREYFAVMIRVVLEHKGRIDKIMGDGLLAVFGDPVENEQHALAAVEVALKMQREMTELRRRWAETGKAELAIRVGIATGEVFVGNIGAAEMKIEYTVLGPTVNLASRLEGKAPPSGVLVSAETQAACTERFDFQPVSGLNLKGFSGPYTAHLLVGPKLPAEGRRRAGRVEVDTRVELVSAAQRLFGTVRNASATGAFIECEPRLPVGAPVELQWRARDGELASLRGRVEHRSDTGVGVSLEGVADAAEKKTA